ncbi:MAG: hypothetical protein ACFFE8_03185 [Candidatus Heimdallarchaeota archaeon]
MVSRKNLRSFMFLIALIFFMVSATSVVSACTIITVSNENEVLFGNNEDWTNPNTCLWFELQEEGKFGGVYLGFDNFFPQGGMNEKGLCFDANALPKMTLNNHPELLSPKRWVVEHIMDVSNNISNTIQVAQEYNWGTSMAYQVHFADANGDALVISPGTDGELNFTRKGPGEKYLVSTNFNVGYPLNGFPPYWRHRVATEMLNNLDLENNLTIEAVRDILDATHQEGTYGTKYSNIFDLKNTDIYIYQNHNFSHVVKLNLDEELAKGENQYIPISDLFSQTTTSETQTEKTQEAPILILLSSLFILFIIRRRKFSSKRD